MNIVQVTEQALCHVKNGTTDQGDNVWREPVENYCSEKRFQNELTLLKRSLMAICLSVPFIIVREQDHKIRAFIKCLPTSWYSVSI
jgi:hypothetical protein